jgi:hypothetical protein
LTPADEAAVRCVPWETRYSVSATGEIRRDGRLLPEGMLLEGPWLPLREFLRPHRPTVLGGGELPEGVAVTLGPSVQPSEPTLLEAASADWVAWGETAPEIRLGRLVYAVDALHPGRALIRGAPLPPIAGQRFVEREQLAVPAGSAWQPALSAATVRASLGAGETELAILWPDGSFSRIPRSAWMAATRSNLRSTLPR